MQRAILAGSDVSEVNQKGMSGVDAALPLVMKQSGMPTCEMLLGVNSSCTVKLMVNRLNLKVKLNLKGLYLKSYTVQ